MTAHIFISGFVQGVGFRQFIKRQARELGITGWVRNTQDNRAEAIFQSLESSEKSAKEKIEKMIAYCRKGPFLAEVKDVLVTWETAQNRFEDFKIKA